jgi:hypothetical protein
MNHHYSAFAENQRREGTNDDERLGEGRSLSRPSRSSMDEHDFFWIGCFPNPSREQPGMISGRLNSS